MNGKPSGPSTEVEIVSANDVLLDNFHINTTKSDNEVETEQLLEAENKLKDTSKEDITDLSKDSGYTEEDKVIEKTRKSSSGSDSSLLKDEENIGERKGTSSDSDSSLLKEVTLELENSLNK